MDQFGVLVESIGFKPYGKSPPMKSKSNPNFTATTSSSFADSSSLPVEELDGVFRSNKTTQQPANFLDDDDVFGGGGSSKNQFGGIDLDSVLNNSGGNLDSVGSNVGYDDLLGLNSGQSDDPVGVGVGDDIFGVSSSSGGKKQDRKDSELEDLVPGFGGSNQGVHSETNLSPGSNVNPSNTSSAVEDDPFLVFESSASQSAASWPFSGSLEQETGDGSVQASLDELDDFVMGHKDSRTHGSMNNTDKPSGTTSNGFKDVDDLEAVFGGMQQKHAARPTSTTEDPAFDILFGEGKGSQVNQTSSWSPSNSKNTSSATNIGDDFTSMFGDVTTSSGEFHEIKGETEERRRARLKRHMRTNARVAEALAEMNQRDMQNQYELEEKHRVAESMDKDIKRWAAGKEGNLRALLSSLQQVLWPECGWRAVSLTDMITSDSVKKVYKKAALYVHPDKVQQKGANLQQKYIAEKVFDLLKEAWNKFSAEELR